MSQVAGRKANVRERVEKRGEEMRAVFKRRRVLVRDDDKEREALKERIKRATLELMRREEKAQDGDEDEEDKSADRKKVGEDRKKKRRGGGDRKQSLADKEEDERVARYLGTSAASASSLALAERVSDAAAVARDLAIQQTKLRNFQAHFAARPVQ